LERQTSKYVQTEDFRLLGDKTPVPTAQETHYLSATEPSLLMLALVRKHGVTSQKTAFFIVIAVKTSNIAHVDIVTVHNPLKLQQEYFIRKILVHERYHSLTQTCG
jgi:hypothetical protein